MEEGAGPAQHVRRFVGSMTSAIYSMYIVTLHIGYRLNPLVDVVLPLIQVAACTATVLLAALWPKPGQHVLVVFAPGTDQATVASAVAAAGGALVDGTGADWMVVAAPQTSSFVTNLYGVGALFAADAGLAYGCTIPHADRIPHEQS